MVREKLWQALVDELGVPDDLVAIIRNMYIDSRGVLRVGEGGDADIWFTASKGVKQGDGASPELFALYFDRVYAFIL